MVQSSVRILSWISAPSGWFRMGVIKSWPHCSYHAQRVQLIFECSHAGLGNTLWCCSLGRSQLQYWATKELLHCRCLYLVPNPLGVIFPETTLRLYLPFSRFNDRRQLLGILWMSNLEGGFLPIQFMAECFHPVLHLLVCRLLQFPSPCWIAPVTSAVLPSPLC